MTLEHRITRLEGNLKGQEAIRESDISTDSLISKLGLDPDTVRDTARANGQSLAEVVTDELDMSYGEFQKALRLRVRGKDTS